MFKALDEQQETLQSDADNLADLQTQATSAQGQMEAFRPLTSLQCSNEPVAANPLASGIPTKRCSNNGTGSGDKEANK